MKGLSFLSIYLAGISKNQAFLHSYLIKINTFCCISSKKMVTVIYNYFSFCDIRFCGVREKAELLSGNDTCCISMFMLLSNSRKIGFLPKAEAFPPLLKEPLKT